MKPRTVTVTLEIVTDARVAFLRDMKMWKRLVGLDIEQVQVNVVKPTKRKGCK